jgi:hypothetical protein
MPTVRSVSNIKDKLFRPALTSYFEVTIPIPVNIIGSKYLSDNGLDNLDQEKLNLLCSETILPGSSLNTHEINNDFTGVTERYAYRRVYDDRIDFTFYVDAGNYIPIRYFETWIKYIANEDISEGAKGPSYSYRFRYPNQYIAEKGLSVTKFERDNLQRLTYNFVNAYPIAVTSIPVSYDAASLLKCTVSFTYIRYYITPNKEQKPPKVKPAPTPKQAAQINGATFSPGTNLGVNYGGINPTGGFPIPATLASGNTTNVSSNENTDFGTSPILI